MHIAENLSCPLLVVLFFYPTGESSAQPNPVFVFNDPGVGDSFDKNAKGYIFQELGLLDENGRPLARAGDNFVNAKQDVVGSVIRKDNQVIGYQSADGKAAAYNVSANVKTDYAWQQVANGGVFHIIKHGANFNQGEVPNTPLGGGIDLDKDTPFVGFGEGTVPPDVAAPYKPYKLKNRPEDKIKVILNCCWSANDTDGDGPNVSVAESIKKVKGVAEVSGHTGTAYVQCSASYALGGTATATQQTNANNALKEAAKAAGAKNVGTWIGNLPFEGRYDEVSEIIKKHAPDLTLKLEYAKTPEARKLASRSAFSNSSYYVCLQAVDQRGGGITYDDNESFGRLTLPRGAIRGRRVLAVASVNLPGPVPSRGAIAQSAIFHFHFAGDRRDQSVGAATLALRHGHDADTTQLHVYRLGRTGRTWERIAAKPTLETRTRLISVEIDQLGTYAAFGPDRN